MDASVEPYQAPICEVSMEGERGRVSRSEQTGKRDSQVYWLGREQLPVR